MIRGVNLGFSLFLSRFFRLDRLLLLGRLGLLCGFDRLGRLGLGLFLSSRLFGCSGLFRLGRLLLLRLLVLAGEIGVEGGLCRFMGQLLHQIIQLLLINGAAGLFGLAGDGCQGVNDFLIGYAKILGDIGNLILKLHGRVPP